MAYSEELADRVRGLLLARDGYSERKMFGGICCMINGNMACGIKDDELMLRLNNELADEARKDEHVRDMDLTGRPMKSMVFVGTEGIATDENLAKWVNFAADFAASLPPK